MTSKPTKHRKPAAKSQPHAIAIKTVEIVDPRWLLKALALTFLVALLFSYLTFCWLFYQGQWQFVLHPTTKVDATPASLNLPFTSIKFAVDHTGQPALTGWYIPADPANPTILYLHDGDSTMSAALPRTQQLHNLGLNIFLFDYRGYGASAPLHPNQQSMTEDAQHALAYLTTERNTPFPQTIPYGTGVGASLVATLAVNHPEIKALILESPKSDLLAEVSRDPRGRLLPLSLLFHDRFPLAQTLTTLDTPKLLLTNAPATPTIFRNAADPKMTVDFNHPSPTGYTQALQRFLDEYLPAAPTPLEPVPNSAPVHK